MYRYSIGNLNIRILVHNHQTHNTRNEKYTKGIYMQILPPKFASPCLIFNRHPGQTPTERGNVHTNVSRQSNFLNPPPQHRSISKLSVCGAFRNTVRLGGGSAPHTPGGVVGLIAAPNPPPIGAQEFLYKAAEELSRKINVIQLPGSLNSG